MSIHQSLIWNHLIWFYRGHDATLLVFRTSQKNLDGFFLEKKTEKLLLSIAKNFAALIEQTHTKPQETLEVRLTQPGETFPFTPPINIDTDG